MKARITQELALSIEPPAEGSGKEPLARVWDTELKGFGVSVSHRGKRVYFLSYRSKGRVRRLTVGEVGTLPAHKARKMAARMLVDLAEGRDPLEERAKERNAQTLGELWCEYADDAKARWKPRTAEGHRWIWEKKIQPELGSRRLCDITRADISRLHRSMKATPRNANRALVILRAMFRRAIEWELMERNPCEGVLPYPEKGRERFLRADEFRALWLAIQEEEALGGRPSVKRAGKSKGRGGKGLEEVTPRGISMHAAGLFRLLILTGARLGEIQTAKWSAVNWDLRALELEDSKTGPRRVPLNEPALAELRRLYAVRCQEEWIIEGLDPSGYLVGVQRPWQRVRKRAGLADVRIHDLRHSFASVAVAEGLGLPIIGKALGHRQGRTTERYAHLAADPVLAAAELVGARIVEAVEKQAAEVVEVKRERVKGAG